MQVQSSDSESRFNKYLLSFRLFNSKKKDDQIFLDDQLVVRTKAVEQAADGRIVSFVMKIFEELFVQAKCSVSLVTFSGCADQVKIFVLKSTSNTAQSITSCYLCKILIPIIEERLALFAGRPTTRLVALNVMSSKELILLQNPLSDLFKSREFEANVALRNLLFVQQKELRAFLSQIRVNLEVTRLEEEMLANGANLSFCHETSEITYPLLNELGMPAESLAILIKALKVFRKQDVPQASARQCIEDLLELQKTHASLRPLITHTLLASRYMILASRTLKMAEKFHERYSIAERIIDREPLVEGQSKQRALLLQKVIASAIYTTHILTRCKSEFSAYKAEANTIRFYFEKTKLQLHVAKNLLQYSQEHEDERNEGYKVLSQQVKEAFSTFRNKISLSQFYNKIHYAILINPTLTSVKSVPPHVIKEWTNLSLEDYLASCKKTNGCLLLTSETVVDEIQRDCKAKADLLAKTAEPQAKAAPLVEKMEVLKIAPIVELVKKEAPFVFKYHGRVIRWFRLETENPFENDPKYSGPHSEQAKRWITVQHNFALHVDRYAKQEGIQTKDQLCLIGEITIINEVRRGIFQYVFDEAKMCFHRYFSIKKDNELYNEYAHKGFYELDYPSLSSLKREKVLEKAPKEIHEDGSFVESEQKHVVVIQDPKNRATIKLCRLK